MIESDGTGTMSGTLRGTLYYPSEQVSSHLHRRFSIAMAEHAQCRLSESVSVNAIDASAIEFIPFSFWYDAPLTSQYSDRRHHPWQVYGSPSYSPARWSSWISPA